MSVGARLKEERVRLRQSQTDFATLAGVKKGTQINWEKGASSPTADALVAYSQVGADVLYILTGNRLPDRPVPEDEMIATQLADIRRDLVEPSRTRRPNETDEQAEERVLREARSTLDGILRHDAPAGMPEDLIEEVSALRDIVNNPAGLSLMRAADYVQRRKRLEEERELLKIWIDGLSDYQPDDAPLKIMATIALEYGVPHKLLAEMSHEIYTDIKEQDWADSVIRHNDGDGKGAGGSSEEE